MNNPVLPDPAPFSVGKVLYFLLPLPVSWLSISLMGQYMKYYDIGVNPSANNATLVFFVLPVLLLVLYLVEMFCLWVVNRFGTSKCRGLLLSSLVVLIIGIGAFFIQVQTVADYPTEKPQNIRIFLEFYLQELSASKSQT